MNTNDEIALYREINKITGTIFLSASEQLIAKLQAMFETAGKPGEAPTGALKTLLDTSVLDPIPQSLFTKYSGKEVVAAWKKHVESVDIGLSFRPRLDLPAESISSLLVAGDKVSVGSTASNAALGTMANFEIEISLGIISGKVSW